VQPLTAFLGLPKIVANVDGAGAGQRDELVVDGEDVLVEVEASLALVICDRLSQDGHQGLLGGGSDPDEGARGVLGQGIEGGAIGKEVRQTELRKRDSMSYTYTLGGSCVFSGTFAVLSVSFFSI